MKRKKDRDDDDDDVLSLQISTRSDIWTRNYAERSL
jgi:hypothetical protein